MRELLTRLEEMKRIGNPQMRAAAAYDLGVKVRSFAGELAMGLVDKNDPYGELAGMFPKVKRSGHKAVKAMQDFAKEVFDTEKSIDITPSIRGRLREGILAEKSQPRLNKYDPGSLLGWVVHLLDKEGLGDAADEVKKVSRSVSRAWKERER